MLSAFLSNPLQVTCASWPRAGQVRKVSKPIVGKGFVDRQYRGACAVFQFESEDVELPSRIKPPSPNGGQRKVWSTPSACAGWSASRCILHDAMLGREAG